MLTLIVGDTFTLLRCLRPQQQYMPQASASSQPHPSPAFEGETSVALSTAASCNVSGVNAIRHAIGNGVQQHAAATKDSS